VGAAAGVGVGAVLGVILIGAAGALLFLKRKRRQKNLWPQSKLQGSIPMGYTTSPPAAVAPISEYAPKPGELPAYYQPEAVELG
jgi:hypothetical protein